MRLVVDASVATKWLVTEDESQAAECLLQKDHQLFAPRLMATEVGHALKRKVRMGVLELSRAGELAATIPDLPITWGVDEDIVPDAIRLALSLECSVYDCVYLALSHRIGAKLVTADARFVNAVAHTEHGGIVTTLDKFTKA